MVEKKKHAGGRPKGSSKYNESFDHLAYVACAEGGFTVPKLAKLLGVSRSTINAWRLGYPSFLDAVNRGRDEFDCGTAESCLLKRVKGYKYNEVTRERLAPDQPLVITKVIQKSIAPDVPGIQFFLRNRDRKRWPEIRRNENTGNEGGPMIVMIAPEDEDL